MDPTACLRRIMQAIKDGDRTDTIAACEDMIDWLASNAGFLPVLEDLQTVAREFAYVATPVTPGIAHPGFRAGLIACPSCGGTGRLL